jgi:hypothetical protein
MGAALKRAGFRNRPYNFNNFLIHRSGKFQTCIVEQVSNCIVGAGSKPALTTKPKIRENFPNTQLDFNGVSKNLDC